MLHQGQWWMDEYRKTHVYSTCTCQAAPSDLAINSRFPNSADQYIIAIITPTRGAHHFNDRLSCKSRIEQWHVAAGRNILDGTITSILAKFVHLDNVISAFHLSLSITYERYLKRNNIAVADNNDQSTSVYMVITISCYHKLLDHCKIISHYVPRGSNARALTLTSLHSISH